MRRILSTAASAWKTTWNLWKVIRVLDRCSAQLWMNAGDMSMIADWICSGGQPWSASSWAMVWTAWHRALR